MGRPLVIRIRPKFAHVGFTAALLGVAVSVSAWAEARGKLTVPIRAGTEDDSPVVAHQVLYGSSHALVIGIDDYVNGWQSLRYAVRDAEEVARALTARGFQVTLKKNLDADELRGTIRTFFIRHGAIKDARLFLWYAGHGHTVDGEGFLVPADAPPPSAGPDFQIKALHMRDFSGLVRLAKSKHVLSVFDSCFAGTIFESRSSGAPPAITRATARPVRQFITSGDGDQEVSDDGTFRTLFLRAITGEENADANGDGYLTGGELGLFLNNRVTNLTEAAQTPRFGKLRDRDFDQGDFVFAIPSVLARSAASKAWAGVKDSGDPAALMHFLSSHGDSEYAPLARARLMELAAASDAAGKSNTGPQTVREPAEAESIRRQAEIAFWNSIKDGGSAADFADYLRQFPDGTFAGLAKRRIEQLAARRTAALTPPASPASPAPAEEPAVAVAPLDEVQVAAKTANVRARPTTESERVGRLRQGTRIAVTGRVSGDGADWYRVRLDDGGDGFVFGPLLQDEAAWNEAERQRAEAARREAAATAERERQAALEAAERKAALRQETETDGERLPATEPVRIDEEETRWKAVRDSTDPQDLESFIRQFPNGRFATQARQRAEALRPAQVAIVTPPPSTDPLEPAKRYLAERYNEFIESAVAFIEKETASSEPVRIDRIYSAKVIEFRNGLYVVKIAAEARLAREMAGHTRTVTGKLFMKQDGERFKIVRLQHRY